jgi:hypothetical protein
MLVYIRGYKGFFFFLIDRKPGLNMDGIGCVMGQNKV